MDDIDLAGEMVKVVLGDRGFKIHYMEISSDFFHIKNGTLVLHRNGNWLVHLGYKENSAKRKFNNIFESFEEVLEFLDKRENGRY